MKRADWIGRGITAGFGARVGDEALAGLAAKGWRMIRNGSQTNGAILEDLAQEITDHGLVPVINTIATFARYLPAGAIVELQAQMDPTVSGAEPVLRGVSPIDEAAALNAVVPILKWKGVTAYVGMFGWDQKSLAWGQRLERLLDPFFRISVHRYPPTSATRYEDLGRAGYLDFLSAMGLRQWAVLECGWNQGPWKTIWNKIFGGHHHLSDEQQRAAIAAELAFYEDAGADFAVLYQLNDEPQRCLKHPQYAADWRGAFGVRRPDGSWKPSAEESK